MRASYHFGSDYKANVEKPDLTNNRNILMGVMSLRHGIGGLRTVARNVVAGTFTFRLSRTICRFDLPRAAGRPHSP